MKKLIPVSVSKRQMILITILSIFEIVFIVGIKYKENLNKDIDEHTLILAQK